MRARRTWWLPAVRSWHALLVLAGSSFVAGWIGFSTLPNPPAGWAEPVYRSLQMFFLNFEVPPTPEGADQALNGWLQFARFGAFTTAVWTIIRGLFPQVRQMMKQAIRRRSPHCAVILGYDDVGQAIGQTLSLVDTGLRHLTAVTRGITPEMEAKARADGILLVEGSPRDIRLLNRIGAGRARRIFVTGSTDLEAIDTALSVRTQLIRGSIDLRVVLRDGSVASRMAEAAPAGFLGVPGLRWFSITEETARDLIATLRFDRYAVETGAPCQHVGLIGFGAQGEAIAAEVLMCGWRTALGPPRLTILDCDPEAARKRLRLRFPAAFPGPEDTPLPEEARPILFVQGCDATDLDLAGDAAVAELCREVTGWFLATGDDRINLRAALALHEAMVAGSITPAPIALRVRGPDGVLARQALQPVAMVTTFGAIDNVIRRSPITLPDPDALPRALHVAYDKAALQMKLATAPTDWKELPETKRNANRALFRHAAMKIEDAGAEAQHPLNGVPVADPGLSQRLHQVDAKLDYARIDRGTDSRGWALEGQTLTAEEARLAVALRNAALCEHNRWITERALNGFVPTERPDPSLRDDRARRHSNMHGWYDLADPIIRRFDVVMLQALFNRTGDIATQTARPERTRSLLLPHLSGAANAPVVTLGEYTATELRLLVTQSSVRSSSEALDALLPVLRQSFPADRRLAPRRLRFDFITPPEPSMLALANDLARAALASGPQDLMVDALWSWRPKGGRVLGFVGHRSLDAFGGEDAVRRRLRPVLLDLVVRRGVRSLVTGFAPGADQAAVRAWSDLRLPRPSLILPFAEKAADGGTLFLTDTGAPPMSEASLAEFGTPGLPKDGPGHEAQAASVLASADILLALIDPAHAGQMGGTQETVSRARMAGIEVVEINPV